MATADLTPSSAPSTEDRLSHLPIAAFSIVMGLAGLAITAQKAAHVLDLGPGTGLFIGGLAGGVFLVLAGLHLAKLLLRPQAVRQEFAHPVKLHFFSTIPISLLLLSVIAAESAPVAAEALFLIGAPLQLVLTLAVLDAWFNRSHFEVGHLNPAWFIPIVGNVVTPIAGVALGHVEASWFFFSIGVVFWIVLFAIIVNRVLFHHPIPERLAPTLFILVAPPAVSFLAYLRLTGSLDASARVLFHFALFMTLFMATQAPKLMRMRFYLSWWAYSFPLAAMATATWSMSALTDAPVFKIIAGALSGFLALVVAGLAIRTGIAVARREICRPE